MITITLPLWVTWLLICVMCLESVSILLDMYRLWLVRRTKDIAKNRARGRKDKLFVKDLKNEDNKSLSQK